MAIKLTTFIVIATLDYILLKLLQYEMNYFS